MYPYGYAMMSEVTHLNEKEEEPNNKCKWLIRDLVVQVWVGLMLYWY